MRVATIGACPALRVPSQRLLSWDTFPPVARTTTLMRDRDDPEFRVVKVVDYLEREHRQYG